MSQAEKIRLISAAVSGLVPHLTVEAVPVGETPRVEDPRVRLVGDGTRWAAVSVAGGVADSDDLADRLAVVVGAASGRGDRPTPVDAVPEGGRAVLGIWDGGDLVALVHLSGTGGRSGDLDPLGDVELTVTVELGRTRMRIRDILNLAPGVVLELDRASGAPADLRVNGELVARGEVVVVGDEYGLRITSVT